MEVTLVDLAQYLQQKVNNDISSILASNDEEVTKSFFISLRSSLLDIFQNPEIAKLVFGMIYNCFDYCHGLGMSYANITYENAKMIIEENKQELDQLMPLMIKQECLNAFKIK